jgi:hypothetical protein
LFNKDEITNTEIAIKNKAEFMPTTAAIPVKLS